MTTSEQTTETTATPNGAPPMSWDEAAKQAEEARVEREIVEDTIDVKLTEADLADIARANAADDAEKTRRQETVDGLKEELKEEKTAIDACVARMHDRNNAVLKGTQARRAAWIVESVFSTNTARYLDPTTERVVLERPLRADERQVKLPLDDAPKQRSFDDLDAAPPAADDVTDPEALLASAMHEPGEEPEGDELEADEESEEEDEG